MKMLDIEAEEYDELLVEVTGSFGISFSENEIPDDLTVSDLKELVISKLDSQPAEGCCTQRVFNQLKDLLIHHFQLPKEQIRPGTDLEKIIPIQNRRNKWQQMKKELAYPLPALVPANWLVMVLAGCVLLSFGIVFWNGTVGLIGLVGSTGLLLSSYWFGRHFPARNVREYVELTVRKNYLAVRRANTHNPREVMKVIQLHLADYCQTTKKEIQPDTIIHRHQFYH